MYSVTSRRQQGVTLIEVLVGMAIFGLTLAIGMPALANWVAVSKAQGAAEFYTEGVRRARVEAIKRNAVTRMRLLDNGGNGQRDWQVDVCYPTVSVPCDRSSGSWSTVSAAAANDPEGTAAGFRSIARSASTLPDDNVLTVEATPLGAEDVYMTSQGWVNTALTPRIQRLTLSPTDAGRYNFATSAITISLAGMAASKCDPTASSSDSRRCQP